MEELDRPATPAHLRTTRHDHSEIKITARLVVRRVKDARYPDAPFPVWRYHPFFTNSTLPTAQADIVHRRHAIIETVFADLIEDPWPTCPPGTLAPTPPGRCAPRSRTTCSTPPASSPQDPTLQGPTPAPVARPCADN